MSKIRSLQVFHRDGKLIGTLDEVEGQILLISNFTLYGENRKGNRFDFADSA
ncbi:D-aminoacyl-tRNA deacylase [Patescibacteria group bacterium]|nr:D-aminoacyl-tRNA deacylase [Patescibacteria group bacterium]